MRQVELAGWLALCGVAAGCGDGTDSAVGGAGGSGGAGGGGAEVACVDIHVDARVLDDPAWVGPGLDFVRKAFWRTERGLHVAWEGGANGGWPLQVVVSTFDPETGAHLGSQIYDPFPSDTGYATLQDAAGAPDGSFALVVYFPDESQVWGVGQPVALGHLDVPGALNLWQPPWDASVAYPMHVDWNGEAYAVHSNPQPGQPEPRRMHLSHLRPDGTAIDPDIGVGAPVAPDLMYGAIRTDPDSGRTWTASTATGGVWLGGHDREGTLLPGTETEGAVLVQAVGASAQGSSSVGVAIAPDGAEAMLGWYYGSLLENRLQRVVESAPVGDALVLPDAPFESYQGDGVLKVLERGNGGWWMGLVRPLAGIASLDLTDSAVVADSPLVRHEPCSLMEGTCAPGEEEGYRVSHLQALRYEDELWLGFLDGSGAYLDGSRPYRVVRIADHCSYGSEALVLQGR